MTKPGRLGWFGALAADRLAAAAAATIGRSTRTEIQLRIVADGIEISAGEVPHFDKILKN
jgi:hypothetical protein